MGRSASRSGSRRGHRRAGRVGRVRGRRDDRRAGRGRNRNRRADRSRTRSCDRGRSPRSRRWSRHGLPGGREAGRGIRGGPGGAVGVMPAGRSALRQNRSRRAVVRMGWSCVVLSLTGSAECVSDTSTIYRKLSRCNVYFCARSSMASDQPARPLRSHWPRRATRIPTRRGRRSMRRSSPQRIESRSSSRRLTSDSACSATAIMCSRACSGPISPSRNTRSRCRLAVGRIVLRVSTHRSSSARPACVIAVLLAAARADVAHLDQPGVGQLVELAVELALGGRPHIRH